jgi:hypothetical protein
MKRMFYRSFFDNVIEMDTSSVVSMKEMFSGSAYNQPIRFNTQSVTTMEGMFLESTFNQRLILLETSSVTNMASMFENSVFNKPLNMDTSSVTTMESMFQGSAFNQPILFFESKRVVTMEAMFLDSSFNHSLNLNTSSVTNMQNMFRGSKINQPLVFDTSSVMNMSYMFYEAKTFNQPLKWNTSSVTDMSYMFYAAETFNQFLDWDVSNVTNMDYMFYHARSFNQPIHWDMKGKRTNQMFVESGMDAVNKRLLLLPKVIDKSITLYIHIHGATLPDILDTSILNTQLSISYGKCLSIYPHNTTEIIQKIKELTQLYQQCKISEGNRNYCFTSLPMSKKDIEEEYKIGSYIGWTPEEFEKFNSVPIPSKSRSYIYDKSYGYNDDNMSMSMGIYILDDRTYLPIQFPINMDLFTPEKRTYIVNETQYQHLQQRNILNVDVAKQFSSDPLSLSISDEYTQIPHYNNVSLSDILSFFKNLGYNHVNIIDESCRGEITPTPPTIHRQRSEEEKRLYDELKKTRKFGGKTRKRKFKC